MLLKAVIDTEAGSETMRIGASAEVVDRMQEDLQPEALYFFGEDGQRAFFAVFDLADPSQLAVFTEPLFSAREGQDHDDMTLVTADGLS